MKPRRRRLSQQDLKTLGATPGLMVHRVEPDGRARLHQLRPESFERKKNFALRLRACANRLATFCTWRLSERLSRLFIARCHIRYLPIGAAS